MISEAAIAELKARNPCDQVAARYVSLRRHGKKMMGPCPLHSPNPQARDSTSFECDADGWVCATCQNGGDCVKLIMLREGCDFPRAIELLGGIAEPSTERAAELEREQAARREKNEREANSFREKERRMAFDIWHAGGELRGSPAEAYLQARGITELPDRVPLRFAPEVAYFHGQEENEVGHKSPRVIFRGPAMLAAIVDAAGKFRAVHVTWIDVDRPGNKKALADPDTGEALPAKKVRGSKAGNIIRLHQMAQQPRQLILGEGIETVLSVWLALHTRDRLSVLDAAFWSGVDLGNIAGRAIESVRHPTLKDAAGRARPVPGPEPDLKAPGIVIPDSVDDVLLLGDGDSDRFTTQCALVRASKRFAEQIARSRGVGAAPARERVKTAFAPDGMDFNDLLREAA